MNGPHDVGGRAGFGEVMPEADEPAFHADWERQVLGLTLCCGALRHWTLDESRHARESLPPALYYSSSYYQIWLTALEALLIHHGEMTREELDDGVVHQAGLATERCLKARRVPSVLATGAPTARTLDSKPRYRTGDRVRTIVDHTKGHTRLPGYARDKPGTVVEIHEAHVFPDSNARGQDASVQGEQPEWLYTVAFEGKDLWGNGAEENTSVTLEAWESYLRAE